MCNVNLSVWSGSSGKEHTGGDNCESGRGAGTHCVRKVSNDGSAGEYNVKNELLCKHSK